MLGSDLWLKLQVEDEMTGNAIGQGMLGALPDGDEINRCTIHPFLSSSRL